jgi:hypothetical protein
LKAYLKNEFKIRPEDLTIIYTELPYNYSKDHFAWVALGLVD